MDDLRLCQSSAQLHGVSPVFPGASKVLRLRLAPAEGSNFCEKETAVRGTSPALLMNLPVSRILDRIKTINKIGKGRLN